MVGFTKLWQCILSSSIWNEDDKTRIVWITLLALKEEDGIARASVGGLAHMARVSKEDTEKAIKVLEQPDPDSRSADFDGRRIEKVDGGFRILNHEKYRTAMTDIERRHYMRDYMREWREQRRKEPKEEINKEDTDTDTDGKDSLNNVKPVNVNKSLHDLTLPFDSKDFEDAWNRWIVFRKEKKQKLTPSTIKSQLKMLEGLGQADAIESIDTSILHGWTGLFEPKQKQYVKQPIEVDYSKGF